MTYYKSESIMNAFEMILAAIRGKYKTYDMLKAVPELGAPNSFKRTGISERGYKQLMMLIDETLILFKRINRAITLQEVLSTYKEIFGPAFPEKLG